MERRGGASGGVGGALVLCTPPRRLLAPVEGIGGLITWRGPQAGRGQEGGGAHNAQEGLAQEAREDLTMPAAAVAAPEVGGDEAA